VVVISDAKSLCQDTCPLDTATIVKTARDEPNPDRANDTVFLSITVDPKRDTRAELAAYRRLFTPAPPNWLPLTASPATVDTLWDYLGGLAPEGDKPTRDSAPA
jgi:protein SCO1/2